VNRFRRLPRLDKAPIRLPVWPAYRQAKRSLKQGVAHALRVLTPTLIALSFAGVAHAQGTMDFSGAQTLMTTFKTFAIYAGAIICFGGLIFAGIRMMSGRFHFTAPSKDLGVANRDLGTVQRIDKEGQLFVKMDNGKSVNFDTHQMRHFDHGYAVTSHSSQGLTAERVMVNLDSHIHADLISKRFAYVAVSRGSHDAHIYTDNAASLVEKLSHDVVKSSAIAVVNPSIQMNDIASSL
jgi:hypothetical protein